jgi:cytochrome b561
LKKNYTKIVLDLMMAITFVLLMNPRVLDGLPFHEIAGTIIGVAILVHIGLNYRWVINTTKKIFDPKLPSKTRFSFLLNILLLISMAAVIITGILISRVVFPSLAIQGGHSVRGLHSLSADATLALVGLHIGVHWQWIMSMFKKAFKSKEGKLKKGVIASVVLSLAILAGGIQWFSSTSTPTIGDFNQKQMQQIGQPSNSTDAGNATVTRQGPPDGDFQGGRGGHDGHGRSSSPFLVILNYFAIWAVIIIPTYILEKSIQRNKRKTNNVQLQ